MALLKKMFLAITSMRVAVWLLVLSIGVVIVFSNYSEYYSPLFLVVPGMLLLSLVSCVARRGVGVKAGVKTIGSLLFHGGIAATIMVVWYGEFAKFEATVDLPQDLTVGIGDERFFRVVSGNVEDYLYLKLNSLKSVYKDDKFPVEYSAELEVGITGEGGSFKAIKTVKVNAPVRVRGYQLNLNSGIYSPRFRIEKKNEVIFDSHITVGNSTEEESFYKVADSGISLVTRFFPDMYRDKDGNYGTASRMLKNPAFGIIMVNEAEPFKEMWKGVLKPGEKAKFRDVSIEFVDLKPVATVLVSKDVVFGLLVVAWAILVIGLVLRYGSVLLRGE